jgi:hypothetical protein
MRAQLKNDFLRTLAMQSSALGLMIRLTLKMKLCKTNLPGHSTFGLALSLYFRDEHSAKSLGTEDV